MFVMKQNYIEAWMGIILTIEWQCLALHYKNKFRAFSTNKHFFCHDFSSVKFQDYVGIFLALTMY